MSLVKTSIFFWHCFSFFKKKQTTKTPHKRQKKWLMLISQCTKNKYFVEKEDIYQQMKQRQAKENIKRYFLCFINRKEKKRLVMHKVKIFIQSSRVVTTVTKPKLHLAAERKYRNDLWLIQFWLCWVFRAVPILARLQFKPWCCMDWLQVTAVIQHVFWKVWLTFPLLETKIHCKNLLVLHILWNTALENLSSIPCDFLVGGRADTLTALHVNIVVPLQNNAMKNFLWWMYVLSWL